MIGHPSEGPIVSEMGQVVRFADLEIGAKFRFPPGLRIMWTYYKTGSQSYGLSPSEPHWPWGESYPREEVERA